MLYFSFEKIIRILNYIYIVIKFKEIHFTINLNIGSITPG